jgi:hypothetical protein
MDFTLPEAVIEERGSFHATTDGARRVTPGLQPCTEVLKNITEDRQRGIATMGVGKQRGKHRVLLIRDGPPVAAEDSMLLAMEGSFMWSVPGSK